MPNSMSLKQAEQSFPLDFSQVMKAETEEEYDNAVHNSIRTQLQSAGLVGPTSNVTNFNLEPEDDRSWFDSMRRTIMKNNPAVFDDPSDQDRTNYLQRRFEFISEHEGWRSKTYEDTRGFRTVGFGFNLDEPTNRTLYKNVLNKTDEDFEALRNGQTELSNREGRILFEAAAGSAERLISNKFSDTDLKGYERLSLISLAYNSPKLIGPNLTKHIKSGDRKAAFDEIKFRSNGRKSKGIQNRRDLEAQMFSGMNPDDAEDSEWSIANLFGIASAEAGELRSSNELIENGRKIAPRPRMKPTPPEEPKKVGSWLSGILPSAVRSLASDLMDLDLESTRNEDYLSGDEQKALRLLTVEKIKQSGRRSGAVDYDDYDGGIGDVAWNNQDSGGNILSRLFGDSEFSVKYTLGAYNYKIDDRGHLIIIDQYNWNDAKRLQKENPTHIDKIRNLMIYSGREGVSSYGKMRRLGALWGSKSGEGNKWEMDLGPVDDPSVKVASR